MRPVKTGVMRKGVRKDTPFGRKVSMYILQSGRTAVQLLLFPLIEYNTENSVTALIRSDLSVEQLGYFPPYTECTFNKSQIDLKC